MKLAKKKTFGCASFFNPLLGVWKSDQTLFLVFDILLMTSVFYAACSSLKHQTLFARNTSRTFAVRIKIRLFLVQANVDWRTDFLVQHYGEGALKNKGCPHLSSGVSVSTKVPFKSIESDQ